MSENTKERCLRTPFRSDSHAQQHHQSSAQHLHVLLTFVLFSSAWIPLSMIFTAICPSDISGRRNGGLTNTVCSGFGRPRYLVKQGTNRSNKLLESASYKPFVILRDVT